MIRMLLLVLNTGSGDLDGEHVLFSVESGLACRMGSCGGRGDRVRFSKLATEFRIVLS